MLIKLGGEKYEVKRREVTIVQLHFLKVKYFLTLIKYYRAFNLTVLVTSIIKTLTFNFQKL